MKSGMKLCERDLQLAVFNYRHRTRPFPVMVANVFMWYWESDILYVTDSRYAHEFEIKTTHSDFVAEKEKHGKFENLKQGKGPASLTYVCPPGVITESEVPDYAGLAYAKVVGRYYRVDPSRDLSIDIIRPAPRHKSNPLTDRQMMSLCKKMVTRYWGEVSRNGYSVSLPGLEVREKT